MEVKEDWLSIQDVATPTTAELDVALADTGPGTARIPEATASPETVASVNITIDPLTLVHPLLRSPFLTPVKAWNLIPVRAASLVLERRVTSLLHCIRDQTSSHAKAVDALSSVDLTNLTLQVRQELKDKIIPPPPLPPPLAPIHTPVQFLLQIPAVAAPPPAAKQVIGNKEWWIETLSSLLRLWNATAASNLPPI